MTKETSGPASAVAHIEGHLLGSLSLEGIAATTNYSKHHLHRRFTQEAAMTMGEYISRRRLTEAAKMLVFTDRPILDVATSVGFGSQQAFSSAFKRMFKKTPGQYRAAEEYWPLQSRLTLDSIANSGRDLGIRFATSADEGAWMGLVDQVVDGYPHLNEGDYLVHLRGAIASHEALVCATRERIVGTLVFSRETGAIGFLGVLPQLRGSSVSKMLLRGALEELPPRVEPVSTTTFREGDAADTGWRSELLGLGFVEGELLTEFGYPTQRLRVSRDALRMACDA